MSILQMSNTTFNETYNNDKIDISSKSILLTIYQLPPMYQCLRGRHKYSNIWCQGQSWIRGHRGAEVKNGFYKPKVQGSNLGLALFPQNVVKLHLSYFKRPFLVNDPVTGKIGDVSVITLSSRFRKVPHYIFRACSSLKPMTSTSFWTRGFGIQPRNGTLPIPRTQVRAAPAIQTNLLRLFRYRRSLIKLSY